MADVRSMFDKEFLYAFDLDGREVVVEIASVTKGEVVGTGGKKAKKPVVRFKGKEKALALNITNVRTIGGIYGFKAADWVGKRITLYATTTNFGGQTVDCIRVRPTKPGAKAPVSTDPPPADESTVEPGADDNEEAVA